MLNARVSWRMCEICLCVHIFTSSIFVCAGDLLYLDIVTLEGQDCFITATPSGFFLNKTTSRENFDPSPRKTSHFHKHLVALLCQVSQKLPSSRTPMQPKLTSLVPKLFKCLPGI